MKKPFLEARWDNLIMANYVIEPALLLPYLPNKTELDIYNGNMYVSLVGFMFADTRMLGFKVPFHINFEEVNLRFYVRHKHNGEWKRGVVFIKEIVPKIAITTVANTLYKEKYCTMPMRNYFEKDKDELFIKYQWKYKGRWNSLQAATEKYSVPMQNGSEEEFIAEHYWGYSKYNSHTTFEYAVEHPAWQVYPVKKYEIDCDFAGLYGSQFSFLKDTQPSSVFVARGSAIKVLNKRKL